MKTIRLRIAYDGTNFAGWQVQPDQTTIQSCVEQALFELTGKKISVLSAGRTDSGVHAIGQVASFRSNFNIPAPKWRPALQSKLPKEIVILESDHVHDDFHATFSSTSKRYRYLIYNNVVDNPFFQQYAWRISQPLDAQKMHDAAQSLIGKHDFRSFESNWPNKATSIRTITDLSVTRSHPWNLWSPVPLAQQTQNTNDGPIICLEIEADGFLYNMVRTITGTLVNVGRGTWDASEVQRIMLAQDRTIAGATAPACGLYLAVVHYPESVLTPSSE